MRKVKVAVVGGGSVAWSPRLISDLLLTDGLEGTEYRLLDIDLDAAKVMAKLCSRLSREWNKPARFVPTKDQKKALKDADAVIITISTGGLDAMEHELVGSEGDLFVIGETPERKGIGKAMLGGKNVDQMEQQTVLLVRIANIPRPSEKL